jgi:hypothetical protein
MIEDLWYKNAVIYSLDLETFLDSDGDGVGDFNGLIERLDYLQFLGVDAIWLAPFQRSPNRDNGYDVADYYSVDPRHGTLATSSNSCTRRTDAGSRSSSISWSIIRRMSIRGSSRRAAARTRHIGTGTTGRRSGRATGTGAWCSPASRTARGRMMSRRARTTSTASTTSSRI